MPILTTGRCSMLLIQKVVRLKGQNVEANALIKVFQPSFSYRICLTEMMICKSYFRENQHGILRLNKTAIFWTLTLWKLLLLHFQSSVYWQTEWITVSRGIQFLNIPHFCLKLESQTSQSSKQSGDLCKICIIYCRNHRMMSRKQLFFVSAVNLHQYLQCTLHRN